MIAPAKPHNEAERTQVLQDLGLIYSPSEPRFDRITRLAMRHFDVSACLVSLVYKEIQWFKSVQGLNACSTDRELSFCGHAILHNETMVVENALLDPRFMDNPLVLDAPRLRFYAGQPLKDPFGVVLGTLCIMDGAPRAFSQEDRQDLQDFARLVEIEIAKNHEESVVSRFIGGLSESQRVLLIDPVVGSWNRRGFEALVDKELEFAKGQGEPLALLKVTLQSYDALLARFGQERMVDFSKFTAGLIRDTLPESASLGSWGPQAFVAVLPHVEKSALDRVAEQLKKNFQTYALHSHGAQTFVGVDVACVAFDKDALPASSAAALDALK